MAILLGMLAAVLALLVPYMIWSWYHKQTKIIYKGQATVLNHSLLPRQRSEQVDYDFLPVTVPGYKFITVEVSKERLGKLTKGVITVEVTVAKSLLGKPFIESVLWPDETTPEQKNRDLSSLCLSGSYLLLGVLSLIAVGKLFGSEPSVLQHIGLYFSALVISIGGFACTWLQHVDLSNMNDAKARFAGIKLGKGKAGLIVMMALLIAVNVAIFWMPTILLLLGINTAFAMGGCAALLRRYSTSN